MKKYTVILLLLLSTTLSFAQKKEKVKGSKTVTVELREIGPFESLEIEDNLEIYLERGDKNEIKIEADENLQDLIILDLKDKTLRIYTSKHAVNYKKLIVRVTYTNDLNLVTSKNETTINAIQEILLENITFKSHDYSQLFLNVNAKNFILQADDKSKTELNLKSENTSIEMSKNATLKALVSTIDLKVDLYQKATATIEGTATNAIIRLDNNSELTGNKLTIKNIDVTAESYSNCSINAVTTVIIDVANKSEIQLVGAPKIEIRRFADEAKLIKKLK
ncbi:GIN domain-containing protein [Flavobacterium sinopsychrotolerans]|uniref:Putative auto-transporter adhesin, head GIN domain n=1 Tax=Flavobacterium sinopsychrotolerans TaxID=604089 RepID=A0A1H8NSQ6_9FLAO|nr:DUF2807 domain-containing protein [Flavobacterium sinopsychrotolerans]SEO32624.1 Putative auto-transporter adhesin, head GIN domain [Flavobacterium sinopsychrotolerans]